MAGRKIWVDERRGLALGVYGTGKARKFRILAHRKDLAALSASAAKALLNERYEAALAKLKVGRSKSVPSRETVRVRQAMQDWMDAMQPVRSPNTMTIFARTANEYVGANGNHALVDFTLQHYDRFVSAIAQPRRTTRQGRPPKDGRPRARGKTTAPYVLSIVAQNIRLKALSAFLGWAHSRGLIQARPRIPLLRVHKKLPVVATPAEIEALYRRLVDLAANTRHPYHRKCYRHILMWFMLARFLGARRQEMYWLEWRNVDLDARKVMVRTTERFKVKERHEKPVPLAPQLHAFLAAHRQANPEHRWLLDDGRGNLAYRSVNSLTSAMHREWLAAGCNSAVKPNHVFRALVVLGLLQRGVPADVVQRWLGHKDIRTTLGYDPDPGSRVQNAAVLWSAPEVGA